MGGGEQPRKFYQALCTQLYAYAEWDFRNGRRVDSGGTEGDHRKSAAAQFEKLGIKPRTQIIIASPPFPESLRYLWHWFREIQGGVQGNGTTYPIITWEALDCWARLTREEVAPRDARMIVALSNLWVGIMAEKIKDAAKR